MQYILFKNKNKWTGQKRKDKTVKKQQQVGLKWLVGLKCLSHSNVWPAGLKHLACVSQMSGPWVSNVWPMGLKCYALRTETSGPWDSNVLPTQTSGPRDSNVWLVGLKCLIRGTPSGPRDSNVWPAGPKCLAHGTQISGPRDSQMSGPQDSNVWPTGLKRLSRGTNCSPLNHQDKSFLQIKI